MHLTTKFLDAVAMAEDRSSSPLRVVWPMPGNVGGTLLSFSAFADWRAFVLELALRDRYVGKETERRRKSVTEKAEKEKRKVVMTGECKPSLAKRRNDLAHGAPFGSPCAGLFELVRDLIDYAYRDWNLHQTFAPE
jgi:hypothetical protein